MSKHDLGTNSLALIRDELEKHSDDKQGLYIRFLMASLSSIPWVGGFIGAAASMKAEKEQGKINALQQQWLEIHQNKLEELAETISEIISRLNQLGEIAQERLSDDKYLNLVQQGFRVWDEAPTEEKKDLISKLLTNAGGTKLCSDDVVRLFIDWIEQYHEIHFAVIRAIYKYPQITRAAIWEEISGEDVRDDSAEADIFKLIIRDLSTGSVIRQDRETTADGRFVRKRQRKPQGAFLLSPFDDIKPYVLTGLGSQFVHYAMNEASTRLQAEHSS